MKQIIIVSRGIAECVKHLNGRAGLEGYLLGSKYMFERAENDLGEYVRVFCLPMIEDTPTNFTPPFEHDTCGTRIFSEYFRIISENNV